MLSNFYPGTTKVFSLMIALNGQTPDITADVVTLRLKKTPELSDSAAALTAVADVTTSGVNGVALFSLSPAETKIEVGAYYYDIVWERQGGDEYVVLNSRIEVIKRISDA